MAAITLREQFDEICIKNKYYRWYFSIIENAIARGWTKKTAPVYTENHHIVPDAIIKNKEKITLTAREHFICHVLLPKFVTGKNKNKMIYALVCMKMKSKQTKDRYINSILYDNARKKYSEYKKQQWKDEEYKKHMLKLLSENHPGQAGEKNPMYGRRGELSPHYKKQKTKEHREKIKNALLGMKYSEERCKNMSLNCPKNALGKKWYHDHVNKLERYFTIGTQPEGFVLGRLKCRQ
jgi:hypothetical protein